jgi:hypothetical protein
MKEIGDSKYANFIESFMKLITDVQIKNRLLFHFLIRALYPFGLFYRQNNNINIDKSL